MSIPKFQVQKNLTPPATIAISGSPDYVGTYGSGTTYATGDVVTYNGSSYVARQATTGNTPGDTAYWQTLASQGNTGAQGPTGAQGAAGAAGTNGVINTLTAGTNLNGGGSAATVTVNLDSDISVNSATFAAASPLIFEGATANDYETTVAVTDPTADRTVTIPDGSGTVAFTSSSITGNAATATALQTARTIGGVSFDGTGNINLPGVNTAGSQDTSGTAAEATNVTATANNTADETVYLTFVDGATGTQGIETDTGLNYNPNSGVLTTTSVTGNLTGNVTGNVSGSAGSATGNAATATEATNVTATANNTANETVYLTFVDGATGTQGIETDTGLNYNPSTGVLTTTSVTGNLTGNVTGNTSGSSGSTTGNAATATALATARAINGVDFDGTGAITVTAAAGTLTGTELKSTVVTSSLTSVGTLSALTVSGTVTMDSVGITAVQTSSESFADNDTSLMTSAAIDDRINAAGGGGAAGSNTQVQYNSSGSFAGSANFTFDGSAAVLKSTLTVGVDDTGHDVKFFGATSGKYMLWDESEDELVLTGGLKLDSVGITTVQTGSESFADNDTSVMTSAAVQDKILSYGYTTNVGDITGVTAGTNLTGGGSSGAVTINLAASPELAADNYYKGSGSFGWYNTSQGTGMYSNDSTWVRTWDSGTGVLSLGGMAAALSGISSTSGYQYLMRGTTYTNFAYYTSMRDSKEQITNLTNTGAIVDALNPVTFVEAAPESETDAEKAWREADIQYGFVAEEIAENNATSHLGQYDAELNPVGWKWQDTISVLTAEVKSLRQRVSTLEGG